VYNIIVKKKELIKRMKTYGWWKYGEGSNHEIWTNGEQKLPIPRHSEVNELTAKAILKTAKSNLGRK